MLTRATALKGYTLNCIDGQIGTVKDLYFDDHAWTIRYLVVGTGSWLSRVKVLISPHALRNVDEEAKCINVHLRKNQIEHSPSLERDKPVSRQFEEAHYIYYGWPMYWRGEMNLGGTPEMQAHLDAPARNAPGGKPLDSHLRSADETRGYHVLATDGEVGHVEDLLVDAETWAIRYLILDTRNWWPGKKVLVSPSWIGEISWAQQAMKVIHSRAAIQKAPEYGGDSAVTRSDEVELHLHYGLPGYWAALMEATQSGRSQK